MSEIISCAMCDIALQKKHVVHVTFKGIDPTVEEVKEYLHAMEKAYDQCEGKFVVLFDATKTKWISGQARIDLGKGIKLIEQKYIETYVKGFFIIPNTVVKLMLKGVNVVLKPKVPQKIFSTYEAANTALEEEIANW